MIRELIHFLVAHKEQIETIQSLLEAAGLLIAVPLFFYTKLVVERKHLAMETYRNLNNCYMDVLKFMSANIDLDPFETTNDKLTPVQEQRLGILYSMLIALFERAWLHNKHEGKWMKRQINDAWGGYIRMWVMRDRFRDYLLGKDVLNNDDPEFTRYLKDLIHSIPKRMPERPEDTKDLPSTHSSPPTQTA
jgi:hypothetical protein